MASVLPRSHKIHKETGDYRFRISGVPIWAAHKRTFKRPDGTHYTVTVTGEELKKVAEKHNRRFEQDAYRAPIHEVHNDGRPVPNEEVAHAGRMTVGKAMFEGKVQDILFMDYLVEDEERLEKVKANPYRSPEISFDRGELSSLALMRREAPFFKFPNFKAEKAAGYSDESEGFVQVAGGFGDDTYVSLYRDDARYAMANAQTKQTDESKVDFKEDGAHAHPKKAKGASGAHGHAPPGMSDDEFGKYMGNYMKSDHGKKAMSDHMDGHLKKMFMEDDDDEGDGEPAALITKKPAKFQEDDTVNYSEQNFELQGQLDAALQRISSLESLNEEQTVIQYALSDTAGVSRGDDALFREKISVIYKDGGVNGVKLYVQGLLSGAPERIVEDVQTFGSVADNAPEEVAKYRNDPAQFKKAEALYVEFQDMSRSLRSTMTPAQYIDSGMASSY